jgi:predicted phage-related endonuclease
MNEATKMDLEDLQGLLEALQKRLPKLPMASKVDVAARLRALSKTAETIDKDVKEEIKAKLNGKPGTVPGELFKATLSYVPTTRLNQQTFKAEYPKIYERFLETTGVQRVTYEIK